MSTLLEGGDKMISAQPTFPRPKHRYLFEIPFLVKPRTFSVIYGRECWANSLKLKKACSIQNVGNIRDSVCNNDRHVVLSMNIDNIINGAFKKTNNCKDD